ncbi:response regulator transcription factor [Paenibacillus periandrae]|uniref:response regulator transcription factor n=1 Tax=Paenibacillus periandrae TaxID=1761741 RepID=UPI001F08F3CC|nr:response regulator [Paenibacillus periandrae]
MYQILIVDDEIHAVSAIKSGVDWAKLSVSKVHAAYNIRQAKEVFTKHVIDIMLCDIEMPQGNGIELLTWVREHYTSTESIFLTCHSDFTYAKKALQLGSLDYMLKPVRYNELESVLQKAIEKVEEKRERHAFNETYKHYFRLWSMHQPILMERFWQDLLHQVIPSNRAQIREALLTQNIPYQEDREQFLPVLISVQRWYKELTSRDEKIMEYALRNAAEDMIVKRDKHAQLVQMRNGTLLVLLPVNVQDVYDKELLRQDCDLYIASCNRYFYCDLSCYVGKSGFIYEMVNKVEALNKLETNNVTQNNKVFFLDEYSKKIGSIDLIPMIGWLEMLKQGAEEAIYIETVQYLNSWKSIEGLDAGSLQRFCQSFLQILYHFIQLKGLQAHQILAEHTSPERMSLAIRSVTDLQNWVKESLQQAIKYCRTVEDSQTDIDKIKRFITQNLDQSVSRMDIAQHVHLHPDYLSRMFKKEMGVSLVEYISEERMQLAKELLIKTNMSVSGIAVSVGYSNFSYFAKMFKKSTQLNPLEFREAKASLLSSK